MGKSILHTPSTSLRIPHPNYQDQGRLFADAFKVLEQAIAQRAFPGAATAITHNCKIVALKGFGRFTYEPDSPPVSAESIFDLASVSKVVATTSMAMILYQRGLLDLDAPVIGVVPEFADEDARRREITCRMLLAHSSGLPAHEKLYLHAHSREELIRAAMRVPLKSDPGIHPEYSDIGFIVLGLALERVAGEPLDVFCQREVFRPIAMSQTAFNPPAAWKSRIPPTADDRIFRKRIIQGEVYDENASVMGGVSPQAGVFSTASDTALFAEAVLSGGTPIVLPEIVLPEIVRPQIVRPETLAVFTRREISPAGTSRALGWDTPSKPSQSGKYLSAASFGHLGYTGTSLWIDPERQLSVTLLTNRTWPDGSNRAIKEVRPRFHDAVCEALGIRS